MVTDGVILKFAKSGAGPGPAPLRPHLRNGFWHEGQNSHTKKGGDKKQEAGQDLFLGIIHSELNTKIFSSVAEGEYV